MENLGKLYTEIDFKIMTFFDSKMNQTTFIFIDASYFIFYRYHAISRWFQKSNSEEILKNPIENTVFVEKYRKLFLEKLQEIPKKLGLRNAIILIAKDCNYDNIWRVQHFTDYKVKRDNGPLVGPFFSLTYEENLFEKAFPNNMCKIIQHENLEADDCIAICVKHFSEVEDAKFVVIANDKDFLQLATKIKNVEIRDAKLNLLIPQPYDLFVKIVTGDKSDNIPAIFSRCGEKTALKYFYDRKEFEKRLKKDNSQEKYELNRLLIDFDFIPQKYVLELISSL